MIKDEVNEVYCRSIEEIDKNMGHLIASKPFKPIIYIPNAKGSNYYELLINSLNKKWIYCKRDREC